jgi:hypothetical protein
MMKRAKRHWLRWFFGVNCLVQLVSAALMAFPRLMGSDDEPHYAFAVGFLTQAVLFGIVFFALRSPDAIDK